MAFVPSRGCVYETSSSPEAGGGGGFYRLQPGITSGSSSPVLIQGVDLNDLDVVLPTVTLDNTRILYSYGADFGQITVVGSVLLGKAGEGGGRGLSGVVGWYNKHRVSNKSSPATVSLPGNVSYRFHVVGMSVMEPDPTFHIQPFAIRGLIVEPS